MTSRREQIYSVGTLRYTHQQLYVLFFWVMWNDFSVTLIEQIVGLNQFLLKNEGATMTEMALFGSIGGLMGVWLNPVCSTWSDRLRTPWGRRRPFLFVAAPLFAGMMMIIPFMPDVYHFVVSFPMAAALLGHIKMSGTILFLQLAMIMSGIFNAVLLAIFSYLYWDVVPETVLGRFNSLTKTAALIAGLFWSFFVFGLADHHMKAVYVGTAFFCLMIYLVSTWQLKEGEYPAPDVHKKGGALAPVRAYFVECFSESYYIWIFLAMLANQAGILSGGPRGFYLYYDCHLSYAEIGWSEGWGKLVTTGFGVACGFAIGAMTDRLKPVRVMPYTFAASAIASVCAYFYVHDSWTYLISFGIGNVINFCAGVAFGAFQVEVFPRAKLGQFCSAQAVFYQVINALMFGPLNGMFYDYTHNYRLSFVWNSFFHALAGLIYLKVYFNWKKRRGITPVPHAG